MPKPHRLDLRELRVSTFEPLTPGTIGANMLADSNASVCDCGRYTLNGAEYVRVDILRSGHVLDRVHDGHQLGLHGVGVCGLRAS